jgi:DNA adenine methylase
MLEQEYRFEARPFLKWAGGKRQLVNQIDHFLPDSFDLYIEPFVGAGALFFYIKPKNAILIDNNPVLINVYQVIKNNLDELIDLLKQHKNEEEYYYSIRDVDRSVTFKNWTKIQRASRMIYLNRCCYNGLYRVNSKGQFNVPFGRYKNPNFCDEENLIAVRKNLQNAKILLASYEVCLKYANKNTFVYLDPPYFPISNTSNFTSYTKDAFSAEDQSNLKKIIDKLNKLGSKIMLSNSYCDFILELYSNYNINIIKARRAINSNPNKRGKIKEVLITNY